MFIIIHVNCRDESSFGFHNSDFGTHPSIPRLTTKNSAAERCRRGAGTMVLVKTSKREATMHREHWLCCLLDLKRYSNGYLIPVRSSNGYLEPCAPMSLTFISQMGIYQPNFYKPIFISQMVHL